MKTLLTIAGSLFLLLVSTQYSAAQDSVHIEKTIDSLNTVIHRNPSDPFPVYHKANLFLASGSKEEAFKSYKQIVLLFVQNPAPAYQQVAADSYYQMSQLTYNGGKNYKEAYNYILLALRLYPQEKAYRLQSARTLVKIDETKKDGENQFEALIKEYPKDTEVLLEYALYLEPHDGARAKRMFEKVLRNDPKDAKSLYALGNYEVTKGFSQEDTKKSIEHYLKAEGYLEAALQQEPTNDIYRKKLGDLYSTLMWYYKRQKSKEAAEKTQQYQAKIDALGVKR